MGIPMSDFTAVETPDRAPPVRFEISIRSLLIVIALVLGVWMVIHLVTALLVLVMSLMLVGALSPMVEWLQKKGVRRGLAITTVFLTLAIVVGGLLLMVVPALMEQVKALITHAPEIREKLVAGLSRSSVTAPLADTVGTLEFAEVFKDSKKTLISLTAGAVEILAYGVSVIFLAVYMMVDRDRLRGALFAVVPRHHHVRLSRILIDLEAIVGGYIRGQVITCVLMATFILVLLSACHVPNALAIAAFGGLMDLLPYFGIVLTMVPAVLAAMVKGPVVTATVFALLFAYEEFEGRVLIPLVYGRALRLPSSVVFFSLLAGTVLAGVSGALLALPIAAAALMLVEQLRVELPGKTPQPEDNAAAKEDARSEQQYDQLTKTSPTEEAAAIAVKLAAERKERDKAAEKAEEREKKEKTAE
jgi:predicted PurR-regulated permease PerM